MSRRPTMILAGTAGLSALIYGLVFVRAFPLMRLYQRPLLDLQKAAASDPAVRWWLLGGFVLLGLLYGLGWHAARQARGRAAWAVVGGGALIFGGLLLFLYPFDAADMFDYIMSGRILGVYGGNPFQQVGADFPHDPFLPYMAWTHTPSAYGPVWEMLAGGTARLAGSGIVANVVAFKLLVGLFAAVSAGLVAAILRREAPERALAGTLLLAWNPLVVYETLGHGHNDMAMAVWILAAAWALVARHYTLACLALVMGTLVKFIPVLLLPAAVFVAVRDLPNARARARFVILTATLGALIAAAAYAPFWHGVDTLGIGRRESMYTASLPAFAFVSLAAWLGNTRAASVVSLTAGGLTALFAVWQSVRAWRDRSWLSFPRAAFWVLMFYLLLACLWFQQWYAVWPVGLAALLPPGPSAALGILFSYTALAKPFIFEPLWLWIKPFPSKLWREQRLGPGVMALPGLGALFVIWQALRQRSGQGWRRLGSRAAGARGACGGRSESDSKRRNNH